MGRHKPGRYGRIMSGEVRATTDYDREQVDAADAADHEIYQQWTEKRSVKQMAQELGCSPERIYYRMRRHRARFNIAWRQPCSCKHPGPGVGASN